MVAAKGFFVENKGNVVSSKLDFTLNKYRELCRSAIDSGYEIKTVASYLKNNATSHQVLIMRHDVDRFPRKALNMAKVEQTLGIKTTYYFRKSGFSKPNIIKRIAEMGHEIGYHYENLDEAKGNHERALELFKKRLEQLRRIVNVETICMHGNPLTKWLNRDIWSHYDYRECGISGEAFLSIKQVFYFSDTGRIWDMSRKVKDMLPSALPEQSNYADKIRTTDDLMKFIHKKGYSQIYITAHPERWSKNLLEWTMDITRDTAVNVTKVISRKII
jgi:hypothetical protein